jgi:predicted small metal-binding protein
MTNEKETQMKTMTCTQLGGPCELVHRGDDANEVIKAQDRHLRDAVAAGNTDHEPAFKDMKGRWRRPVSGLKWYRQVQRDFAALPSETGTPLP